MTATLTENDIVTAEPVETQEPAERVRPKLPTMQDLRADGDLESRLVRLTVKVGKCAPEANAITSYMENLNQVRAEVATLKQYLKATDRAAALPWLEYIEWLCDENAKVYIPLCQAIQRCREFAGQLKQVSQAWNMRNVWN